MKDFVELNVNEYTSYSNLEYTMTAVLRGKFVALCACLHSRNRDEREDLTTGTEEI